MERLYRSRVSGELAANTDMPPMTSIYITNRLVLATSAD
jgi:hypothetical protein